MQFSCLFHADLIVPLDVSQGEPFGFAPHRFGKQADYPLPCKLDRLTQVLGSIRIRALWLIPVNKEDRGGVLIAASRLHQISLSRADRDVLDHWLGCICNG